MTPFMALCFDKDRLAILWRVLLLFIGSGYLGTGLVQSQTISLVGDHSPSYNGTDIPWSIPTKNLRVGRSAVGSLTISGSATVTNKEAYLGSNENGSGTATVTGEGATWENSGALYVGDDGAGVLNIEAGGFVSNNKGYLGRALGSSGTVTVTGTNSRWNNAHDLFLGGGFRLTTAGGTGTMAINSGGVVTNINGYLGRSVNGIGNATVAGAGAKWENSEDLYVGRRGTGILNVEAGGFVLNNKGYLGSDTGSTGNATISGEDSHWKNLSDLWIGNQGAGILNIETGGKVTNNKAYLGRLAGSQGEITITGAGTQWVSSSDLYLGGGFLLQTSGGNGMLEIKAGGLVSNTNSFLGRSVDGVGTAKVTGTGSRWDNSGSMYLGGSSSTASGNGVLNVLDNSLVTVTDQLKIWDTGKLIIDHGRLELGSLNLKVDGKIQIHLTETNNLAFIKVVGQAKTNGVFQFDLASGYVPSLGDAFEILSAGSYTGSLTFDFSNAPLTGGLIWDTSDFLSNGRIAIRNDNTGSPVPGDYNGNGTVDAADFTLWRDSLGSSTDLAADGDKSGTVDLADFAYWKSRFGNISGSGSGAAETTTAVPEPSSLLLIVLGFISLRFCRKTKSLV